MCSKILKIKAKNLTLHFCQGRAAIIPSSPSQQSCNQKYQGVDISGHPRIGPISELAKPRGVFVHNVSPTTATSAFTALHFYNLYSSAGQCSVFCDKEHRYGAKKDPPIHKFFIQLVALRFSALQIVIQRHYCTWNMGYQ